jgi:transcriptional regulator with XRE-family HTH domain
MAVKKTRELTESERAWLETIGDLMRSARRGHGSQRVVAQKVGVSQSRISRWESGGAIPDALELIHFAEACLTRPERLIEGVAMRTVEQLHMELDPQAGAVVTELVQILHDRRPPGPAPDQEVA